MPRSSNRNSAKTHQNSRSLRVSSGQTLPTIDWECPHCSRWFANRKNGPRMHLRHCKALVQEHTTTHHHQSSSTRKLGKSIKNIQDSSKTILSGHNSEADLNPKSGRAPRGSKRKVDDLTTTDSDTDSGVSDSSSEGQPSETPARRPDTLLEGEVWVEYHPFSQKPSERLSISTPVESIVLPTQAFDEAHPPWHPFRTRTDFEQAELFVRTNATDSLINQQLKLIYSGSPGSHAITLKSAKELHDVLSQIPQIDVLPEFKTAVFDVPYHHETPRSYTVRFREILPLVHDLLEDDSLQDRLMFIPEKRFIPKPGGGLMRIWEEYSSCDDWWSLQTKIGRDKVIIHIQIYIDSTHVTSFGNVKYWGAFWWLGNIPKADRNDSRGRGRASLFAYLPMVVGRENDNASHLAQHRAEVYHRALSIMFDDVELAAEYGTSFQFSAVTKVGVPIFVTVSADYEEMVRMAGILGANSGYPCPICLIPRDSLWQIGNIWPLRTGQATLSLLKRAGGETTTSKRKERLGAQSLRFIENAFLLCVGFWLSIFQAFVLDPLHAIEQGVFGKHIWVWLIAALPPSSLNHIDECFRHCPRFPGIHHFRNGVTSLKYITGAEYGQILRYLSPYLEGLWPEMQDDLLRALRELACIHLYLTSFTSHTDLSLSTLQSHIERYGSASQRLRNADIGINFSWPKHHSFNHIIDILKRKGPADNYESGLGERLHPQVKDDYERSSHQPQSTDKEMTRMAQERDSILRLRARIDRFDELEDQIADANVESTRQGSRDAETRTALASPFKPVRLSFFLLANQSCDIRPESESLPLDGFLRKLGKFIRSNTTSKIKDRILESQPIYRYRAFRVKYVCMMSAVLRQDILRATPDWRNTGPRYDHAIANGPRGLLFVQVLMFFTVQDTFRLALVRVFRLVGRHPHSDYIQLKEDKVDFIFSDSIIRAIHILPPSEYNPFYTAQDMSSPDIHLRLNSIS